MYAPAIDNSEALGREIRHFLFCIQHGKRPLTDGRAGLGVVRILAAAQESIRKEGQRILLPASPTRDEDDRRIVQSAAAAND
jgi:predicted dehydrogenase